MNSRITILRKKSYRLFHKVTLILQDEYSSIPLKLGHLREEGMKEPCIQMPCLIGQIYFINISKLLTFACITLIKAEFNILSFKLVRRFFLLTRKNILRNSSNTLSDSVYI